jgi:hypothetical protein
MTLKRRAVTALACAVATGAAVLVAAPPSQAAARPSDECFPDYVYVFTGNGVNIHARPFLGAAGGAVYGLGYLGQQFSSRQHTVINEGYTWVYGTDESTGVTGWAVTAYLHYLGDYGTCLN